MVLITRQHGEIIIEGHAGYAPHGQDIVCAGVSTLTQGFIEAVEQLTTDKLKTHITAGKAIIRYKELSKDAQLLLSSFFIGLKMIANEYPNNVKLTEP